MNSNSITVLIGICLVVATLIWWRKRQQRSAIMETKQESTDGALDAKHSEVTVTEINTIPIDQTKTLTPSRLGGLCGACGYPIVTELPCYAPHLCPNGCGNPKKKA